MDWLEVSVVTNETNHDLIEEIILSHGVQGLIVHDPKEFFLFLNDPNREWDYIEDELVHQNESNKMGLTFYVSNTEHGLEQLENIRLDTIEKLGDGIVLSKKIVADSDWENNWKQYYKPIEIGERVVIKPSWEHFDGGADKIVIELDPGQVFGTGTHETTQLVMMALEKHVTNGMKILDIGCGSGILAITALKLGASEAVCVDIDKNAVTVVSENARRNGIGDELRMLTGNVLSEDALKHLIAAGYDIVAANIVADVVIALAPYAHSVLKPGGFFLSSGIIKARAQDVSQAFCTHGFCDVTVTVMGEWASVVGVR